VTPVRGRWRFGHGDTPTGGGVVKVADWAVGVFWLGLGMGCKNGTQG